MQARGRRTRRDGGAEAHPIATMSACAASASQALKAAASGCKMFFWASASEVCSAGAPHAGPRVPPAAQRPTLSAAPQTQRRRSARRITRAAPAFAPSCSCSRLPCTRPFSATPPSPAPSPRTQQQSNAGRASARYVACAMPGGFSGCWRHRRGVNALGFLDSRPVSWQEAGSFPAPPPPHAPAPQHQIAGLCARRAAERGLARRGRGL